MSKVYGYVRVSTRYQKEDRQLIAMEEANIPMENIIIEKQSGKDFERTEYQALLKELREGDVLYVESIDRLGRNYVEILDQWRILTKVKKCDIVVMDMPLLDTRKGKDLFGTVIADLVLQLLSFVAETERDNIKKRQAEGIAAARARGVHLGRPRRSLPDNFGDICKMVKEGKLSYAQGAKECGMPRSSFRENVLRS